jgi:hypothetical protein
MRHLTETEYILIKKIIKSLDAKYIIFYAKKVAARWGCVTSLNSQKITRQKY